MEPSQAGAPCAEDDPGEGPSLGGGMLTRVLPIINNKGLHARASAKFVHTVERFDAEVFVSRCGETVGGLSIMGLMMLAAARGTTIAVRHAGARPSTASEALEAVARRPLRRRELRRFARPARRVDAPRRACPHPDRLAGSTEVRP